jgi:hypothetical protein
VREQRASHPLDDLKPVATLDEVRELEGAVEDVYTDELLLRWIVELVTVTRELDEVALGASVRPASRSNARRGRERYDGRDYVTQTSSYFTPVSPIASSSRRHSSPTTASAAATPRFSGSESSSSNGYHVRNRPRSAS